MPSCCRGRVFRQTDETGRLREQYAQAEGSFDVGRFDFYSLARVGQLREARTPLEHALYWCRSRIHIDMGCSSVSTTRSAARQGIFNLVCQPRRQRQPFSAD